MPRQLRLRLAGVPLHIIQRGNNRARCFHSEGDYRLYLGLLLELSPKFRCSVHAYVLMTNHVHLLLTPTEELGASMLMKNVGQRFAQFANRSNGRTGSLWEGRFRSSLVDTDGYLLRCHRYIECNPVRAGMVVDPADYPWSSYRANALGQADPVLSPHPIYLALGADEWERRTRYVRLFEGEMSDRELARIRDATNGGFPLGSEDFVKRLEQDFGHRVKRMQPRSVPSRGTGGLTPV
jgi:putative transposase